MEKLSCIKTRTAACNYETIYQGYGAPAVALLLSITPRSYHRINSNALSVPIDIGRRVKQMNKGTYAHCVFPLTNKTEKQYIDKQALLQYINYRLTSVVGAKSYIVYKWT